MSVLPPYGWRPTWVTRLPAGLAGEHSGELMMSAQMATLRVDEPRSTRQPMTGPDGTMSWCSSSIFPRHGRSFCFTGDDSAEVRELHSAIGDLVSRGVGATLGLDDLPFVDGIAGCALTAGVGETDSGVASAQSDPNVYRCVLSPTSWTSVLGLLEPFLERDEGAPAIFQFLTDRSPRSRERGKLSTGPNRTPTPIVMPGNW